MYGLLLEGIRQFICSTYGTQAWTLILERSKIDVNVFVIHDIYDEEMLRKLVQAASEHCRIPKEEIMYQNGKYFISFLSHYGYDSILRVLGRDLRDFLNGLDNLHEYLRFSYPKLKPPSFFCVNESRTGITLQYRTQRNGFVHYVRGQIFEIGKIFYNTKVDIDIIGENQMSNKIYNCILRLQFDNISFQSEGDNMSIPSELFFEVFPFNIVFNRGLRVVNCGRGMRNLIPDIIGDFVGDLFHFSRPIMELSWDNVILHSNNVFELILLHTKKNVLSDIESPNNQMESNYRLRMRGQMKYMNEWDAIVFLGTPIMRDVESMWKAGLFINDLSMHDSSRDLVLAGEQQSAELRLALEQESEKSKRLEDSLKRLDDEMRRTDELLYQMIPRAVANRLRNGEKSVNTCETFNEVTILFSDVVGFTKICSNITPLDVVEMLNSMYSVFDQLTERHKVYKVETVGDAYMVASGCPVLTIYNAPLIAEIAIEMIEQISLIKNPANKSESLKIRIGIHTGTVVAGVVGIKMPRYCLFGDTVNTASRMESTGETQKIQISSSTQNKLTIHNVYDIVERGFVEVKGKGNITTYWLIDKNLDKNSSLLNSYMNILSRERERLGDANMSTYQSHGEYWHEISLSRCSSISNSHSRTESHKDYQFKDEKKEKPSKKFPKVCLNGVRNSKEL